MSSRRLSPPWDFFHDASIASLESYELSRLNSSANLRRQVTALLDQWVDDTSQALLARWVRDEREQARIKASPREISNAQLQSLLPLADPVPPRLTPRRQDRVPKLARGQHR